MGSFSVGRVAGNGSLGQLYCFVLLLILGNESKGGSARHLCGSFLTKPEV